MDEREIAGTGVVQDVEKRQAGTHSIYSIKSKSEKKGGRKRKRQAQDALSLSHRHCLETAHESVREWMNQTVSE